MNRLYFGDNLKWLSDRKEFPDASVDLVYLDPPFNSSPHFIHDKALVIRLPFNQMFEASAVRPIRSCADDFAQRVQDNA
jgi:16S rRNA G966 N2-methylase RsmD